MKRVTLMFAVAIAIAFGFAHSMQAQNSQATFQTGPSSSANATSHESGLSYFLHRAGRAELFAGSRCGLFSD